MDLVHGAKHVIMLMEQVAKNGSYKMVNECSLPYTGKCVVQRIITDPCILDVLPESKAVVSAGRACSQRHRERGAQHVCSRSRDSIRRPVAMAAKTEIAENT